MEINKWEITRSELMWGRWHKYLVRRKKLSPVVPAGTICLKCWNTSKRSSSLAFVARSRIRSLVTGSGFSSDPRSKCRISCTWATISLASHALDLRLYSTAVGRVMAFSSISGNGISYEKYSGIVHTSDGSDTSTIKTGIRRMFWSLKTNRRSNK